MVGVATTPTSETGEAAPDGMTGEDEEAPLEKRVGVALLAAVETLAEGRWAARWGVTPGAATGRLKCGHQSSAGMVTVLRMEAGGRCMEAGGGGGDGAVALTVMAIEWRRGTEGGATERKRRVRTWMSRREGAGGKGRLLLRSG